MKHANEIFPLALAELFKLAERGKARNPMTRETRKGDRVNAKGKQNYNSIQNRKIEIWKQ